MSAVLILSEVANRNGEVKRFDVKRAAKSAKQGLNEIPAGQYKVLDVAAGQLDTATVSYRTVQDVVYS